jgi:hypothetical protein
MTVQQLLAGADSQELGTWMALYRLEAEQVQKAELMRRSDELMRNYKAGKIKKK